MTKVEPSTNTPIVFFSPIFSGSKLGRTIGFPTLNLDPQVFPAGKEPGVYACLVWFTTATSPIKPTFATTPHLGALYFGPRLINNETFNVLEVFVLNFNQDVYDKIATIQLKDFIRPPLDFNSFEEMKTQLKQDIEAVAIALKTTPR